MAGIVLRKTGEFGYWVGMKRLVTFLNLLLVGFSSFCSAVEIWVSPDGDDAAAGSEADPVKSFERALELTRGERGPKHIHFTEGTHFLNDTIRLDGRDFALEITGQIDTVISGGAPVLNWEVLKNGLWKAKVPVEGSSRELFVNGKRATRARFPNKDWLRIEKSLPDRRTGFSFNQGDLPKGLGPSEGLELVFLHDWSISRIPVAEIDHDKRVLKVKFPIGCEAAHYAIDHFEKHPRYALEGSLALLDQPGEWAIQDGNIYYKPIDGETIERTEAIVPRLTKLLEIAPGKDGKQPLSVGVFRVNFSHCRWDIPSEGYASGQATVHEWRDGSGKSGRTFIPVAVEVKDSHGTIFEDVKFTHLGGSGLWFRGNSKACDVSNAEFFDISGNAINIGEQGADKVPKGIHVKDSSIHHAGVQYFGSVGIWVGMATNCNIQELEIRNLPYTGISVGWRWSDSPSPCKDHFITQNHIHHVMQVLSDGGGIYTLGRQPGTYIADNFIHDVPLNMGRAQSNGIFLDQGSTEITIERNIIDKIAKSPIRFHQAGKNTIQENLLGIKDSIPAFSYLRTDPKDILFKDNQEVPTGSSSITEAVQKWKVKHGE